MVGQQGAVRMTEAHSPGMKAIDVVSRLTFCEHTQPECILTSKSASRKMIPIRMRGLLEIQSLKWLSEDGRKALLRALRKRDVARRKATRGPNVQESNVELNHIFDLRNGKLRQRKTCFRVIIQAEKAGPAVYLTCMYPHHEVWDIPFDDNLRKRSSHWAH